MADAATAAGLPEADDGRAPTREPRDGMPGPRLMWAEGPTPNTPPGPTENGAWRAGALLLSLGPTVYSSA